jgi:hypothetical protein
VEAVEKKEQRKLARQVTEAVIKDDDFTQEIDAPIDELIGIETQKPREDIIPLEQMNQFIGPVPPWRKISKTKGILNCCSMGQAGWKNDFRKLIADYSSTSSPK